MASDDEIIGGDERFIRAGEFALGVLEGEERAAAQREVLSDRDFPAAVRWWERRLGAMAELAGEAEPSPAVWKAIEARITERISNGDPVVFEAPVRGPSGWSIAMALSGLAAAAAALLLYLNTPATAPQPQPSVVPASEQLIAQLSEEASGRRFSTRIDTAHNRLLMTVSGLKAAPGKAPELWVIPIGGTPTSLGAIPQSGDFARALSEQERALLKDGATLAVTFEDRSETRHATPTMPIVLAGPLEAV